MVDSTGTHRWMARLACAGLCPRARPCHQQGLRPASAAGLTLRTPRNTARDRGINHLDALRRLTLALLLATLLGMSLGSVVSEARQLTVFSCHDPAGNPVGHDGWLTQRTGDLNMSLIDNCSSGAAGALALELGASTSGYGGGARSEWVFSAPTWSTISGYELQIAGSYAIPSTGAGSGQVYVNASDESDPNYDYRNLGAGSLGRHISR